VPHFVTKILASVGQLSDHPRIGRRVPEAARDDVRELIFQNYRIIYLVKSDCLFIVTVLHGSRDLTRQNIKPWDVV
jgi:plasmid stabilization system protein ParE